MRLIICDSKGWFELDPNLNESNEMKIINNQNDLNLRFLNDFKPNFIFFVHWNWIVDENIFSNFECILFHTAPLPYGKGGSPIQNLIINGYEKSPVCALKMIKEIDSGPIYSKIEISLEGALHEIFKRLNTAINQLIKQITTHNIKPQEQIGESYFFKRIKEQENEIPLNLTLKQIYDRIRMLDDDSYPNAFIKYGENKLEFYNAEYKDNYLSVSCKITKWK